MQFTIGRDALFAELNILKKYLSKTNPALGNFLLKADIQAQKLYVFASDMESNITVDIPATVRIDGSKILDSATLLAALKNLPTGSSITIQDHSSSQVMLVCGRTKLKIGWLDPNQFVAWPLFPVQDVLDMKSEDFKALIGSLAFARLPGNRAMQQSDNKFEGIHVKATQGLAVFTCTDKSRFAFGRYQFNQPVDFELVISGKALLDFATGLPDGEVVTLSVNSADGRIKFSCLGKTMIPGMYADKYPDVLRLVPAPTSTVTLKREDLIKKLDIALLVGVIIDIKAQNGQLQLENQGSGTGHFQDDLPATVSAPMEISLNIPFFLDGLKSMSGDEIEMLLTAPDKPAIVRPKGKSEYSYLLLPIV